MSEIQKNKTPDPETKSKGDIHRIRYGPFEFSIPTIAFGLMLLGILLPTAKFSLSLKDPSPSDLLIAICMALFSAVVFLWILDATSLLRFRSEWVSKSIYGAAIVSVLGTSVAVYQETFSERRYPYEGRWEIQIKREGSILASNQLIMMYSSVAETYWGFSDYTVTSNQSSSAADWLKINEFDAKSGRINISYFKKDSQEKIIATNLETMRKGKLFQTSYSQMSEDGKRSIIRINLSRPKY